MNDVPSWRRLLVGARDVPTLVAEGLVAPADAPGLEAVVARFEMLVSRYYLGLIDRDDPACPIRRQALPDVAELAWLPGERTDPIGDAAHAPTRILVRRYPDRALLFPTLRCPMFCRYCFRKVALNEEPIRLRHELPAALDWLRAHPEVEEVILSGGDPLMLSDALLAELLAGLRGLGTVRRIRIHTRMPVTLPMRVDAALAALLAAHRPVYVVAHFNHPRELTPAAEAAVSALVDAGVVVLNQAVLLRGINDDPAVLAALFQGLLDWRVRPYYLHHPDLTVGTGHFRVGLAEGLAIVRALRGRLTGLAWPTYVLDIPGGGGKVPVDSGYVRPTDDPGVWLLESPLDGEVRVYRDLAVLS
ncbi:MAG: KamA family radical SAM protein [Myxococcales bacterium]|nr:KamA family radical SAM protein [Myxococcales bacterium]MCB9547790.1 KamA family radical SAM protein [Myxococcales bacterium]